MRFVTEQRQYLPKGAPGLVNDNRKVTVFAERGPKNL